MKPGIKTTEFWVASIASLFGLLATMGVFTPDQASVMSEAIEKLAGALVMGAGALGYTISRGQAKKNQPPQ